MVDDMLMRRVEQQVLEVRRLMLQHEEADGPCYHQTWAGMTRPHRASRTA